MADPGSLTPRPGSTFLLGGQKSGKSRQAEMLARDWLTGGKARRAVMVATALAHDAEMRERIARHRTDRAARVPGMETIEEPLDPGQAIRAVASPDTLVVLDCLNLWLTNAMMPMSGAPMTDNQWQLLQQSLWDALRDCPGAIVLVSNEIGLGVIPLGPEVRAFVDALGQLNQAAAARCDRAVLMAAGLPLLLKGER